ncbi:hypothetical protein C6568_01785 [Melaminivora suipulveris]|uniref:Uncharacterized protein n=1 Tax=Melaminivora suipulveris TaxID=2109913 RepID=A0A2R3Q922_9BURK|nr:hypothetical protein [Melaminivora suipulveris]AVO48127.1 hypothetical protein C6568_01785 [Melaminivora suipulveris]
MTPFEKLDELRSEFAQAAGDKFPRRINSRVSVQLDVPLLGIQDGGRVIAFVEVRIHSTTPLPPVHQEVFSAMACDRAAERLRSDLRRKGRA